MNHKAALAALESDLVRARDLARSLNLGAALELALDRVFDGPRGRFFACDSHSVRLNAIAFVRALHGDHAHVRDRHLNFVRDLNRARADEIAGDIGLVLKCLRALDQHSVAAAGVQLMLGRVSRGLLALAVWLLPAAQRIRYDAEFRSELGELRRRERWGYALRVLVGAWELRRALAGSVRTPDGDVARRAER